MCLIQQELSPETTKLIFGISLAIIPTMISRNNIIRIIILTAGAVLISLFFVSNKDKSGDDISGLRPSESPEISETESPLTSPSPVNPPTGGSPNTAKTPLPAGNGKTTFIDEPVPWHLLLSNASCELKGEIKFISPTTYDNQDALFIYNGIDHPARNIKWIKTPDDGSLAIGPNIFSKIPIPDGQALLGVFPLEAPKSKKYELTAKIAYGRLVDENGKFVTAGGSVKIFEKQCQGKTIIVFP